MKHVFSVGDRVRIIRLSSDTDVILSRPTSGNVYERFWNGETWLYNVRTDKGDAVCCSRNMLAGGHATERI